MIRYDGRVILKVRGKKNSIWKACVSRVVSFAPRNRARWQRKEKPGCLSTKISVHALCGAVRDSWAQPETVNQAARVNSRRWQTMPRRDEGIVEFTPRGVHSPANIQSPVHSPLWSGNGNGRGGGRGAPSITWEIALALFMCVYTDTSRALGHAAPRRATPRRAIPRVILCYSTPRRIVLCRSSPQRLSIARQRGHK